MAIGCVFAQKLAGRSSVGWRLTIQHGSCDMDGAAESGSLEECADELNDFVNTLDGYAPTVLAFALRAHLSGLLQAMRNEGQWTGEDLMIFVHDMAEELRNALHD
jgi:hypothetical protein